MVDTPGFDDLAQSDIEVLQSIASCVADMYEGLTFPGLEVTLSGAIYIQSINDPRMTGTAKKNLHMFKLLIGEHNMEHCVLASSKWKLEDPITIERRESELVYSADYWGLLLQAGAHIARYQDSQRSALDIVQLATRGGIFLPQLTQEYVVEKRQLDDTAVGRAVDESIAKAREGHERALACWREEHRQALEHADIQAKAELETLSLQAETKLKILADETKQLRATRVAAQAHLDDLETEKSNSDYDENKSILRTDDSHRDKHRARQKRALRWFGRFAAMGSAVTMSVLTSGAMIPVGISLVGAVEGICQMDKDREAAKKYGHKP